MQVMPKTTDRDAALTALLGVPADNITQDDLDFFQTRKAALETADSGEPVLVQEVLICEFNIARIRRSQQELNNKKPVDAADLEFINDQLKTLKKQLDEFMDRYNSAMDSLGVRKKRAKDVQSSPLAECWLRYVKAIEQREKRGEAIGEPSKEAQALAVSTLAAGREGMAWTTDFKVKGVLPTAVRKKAIESVQHPTNIDEKKNADALGVMLDDFLHDPCLAAQCVLAEALPNDPPFTPIHELRIFGLWIHEFYMGSDAPGTGKTFCAAIVSALRCVLMADRHIGILSNTFGQGKLFFEQYYDPWLKNCPVFAEQVECNRLGAHMYHVVRGDDGFIMYFRNNSTLKTLPPNFLNDAQRVKSESWTDFFGDEWTVWANLDKALSICEQRVRRPFGRWQAYYNSENPIFGHHQALLGTAAYKWQGCYRVLKQYERKVYEDQDSRYCMMSFNYLDFTLPRWRRKEYGINASGIENSMERMSPDEKARVVYAMWMNDSTGVYLFSEIKACREPLQGDGSWNSFAGVDVAPGGLESLTRLGGTKTGPKSGDDFAIHVWRWNGIDRPEPAYAERWCGISAPQQAARLHRLHQRFRFITIMCDPNSGGIELYRNVRFPNQVDMDEKLFDVTPLIVENDEQMAGQGDPVWSFFKRGEPKIFGRGEQQGICPPYPGESMLVNQMHSVFKQAIQAKIPRLPPQWPGWEDEMRYGINDASSMRTWLNEHPGFVGEDRSSAEIDLAIQQLIQVERENDTEGKPKLDKYNAYTFVSRSKKDSAYAMLYGYFALWLFMERTKQEQESAGEQEVVCYGSEVT
jgi:hypothetical protein